MCSLLPVNSLTGNGFLFMGSAWGGHTGAVGVKNISRCVEALDWRFAHMTHKQRINVT